MWAGCVESWVDGSWPAAAAPAAAAATRCEPAPRDVSRAPWMNCALPRQLDELPCTSRAYVQYEHLASDARLFRQR